MTVWFTSDLHFGHNNIGAFTGRPWRDTRKMDKALIENINSVVEPHDTLYLLGDISFRNANQTHALLDQINGKLILIRGNHDGREVKGWRGWCGQHDELEMPLHGYKTKLNLCHYPPLRPMPGRVYLHGHLHRRTPGSLPLYDVGVDANNYMPVPQERIAELVRAEKSGMAQLEKIMKEA